MDELARLGGGPWARDELLALGWSPGQVERDADAGRLVRLRRGLYAVRATDPAEPASPRAGAAAMREPWPATTFGLVRPGPGTRRRSRGGGVQVRPDGSAPQLAAVDWTTPSAYAALVAQSPGSVVSHESAARVAGLWLPPEPDERAQLTTEDRPLPSDALVRRHRARLAPEDVVILDGVPFTTVARTAVDLALACRIPDALRALDAAAGLLAVGQAWGTPNARVLLASRDGLDLELRAREALSAAVARAAGRNGCRALARAVPWIDARSESPHESWSRGVLIEAGVVPEAVGMPVLGASGRRYYADLAWPSRMLLAEVDGLGKYGADLRTVRERLAAERHRQADLEDAGWAVVRWTAGERAPAVIDRVRRALAETR